LQTHMYPFPERLARQAAWSIQSVPEAFVLAEQMTGLIQEHLATRGLGNWRILGQIPADLVSEIQTHLEQLDKSNPTWEPLPLGTCSTGLSNQIELADEGGHKLQPAGCLVLRDRHVALIRWYWFAPLEGRFRPLCWAASRLATDFNALTGDVIRLTRHHIRPDWQVFTGGHRGETIPRDKTPSWNNLILEPAVRTRVEEEVVGFFSEPTRTLFAELGLAYRRGVLLWGPPGNGKTGVLRVAAALNTDAAALFLQPGPGFDSDDLKTIIGRWRDQAPAMLVIEDLDWLLAQVSVSTFLNMLDGIDQRHTHGLMLIATTNHPERLDPAINNRPGRFDAVIEVRVPTADLRFAYFQKFAPGLNPATLRDLVAHTSGQSFAHLREVILRSGYNSLRQGRARRAESDYIEAARSVQTSTSIASGGFSAATTEGFGFLNRMGTTTTNKGSD